MRKLAALTGALLVMMSCNVGLAEGLTIVDKEPQQAFLYMNQRDVSFVKRGAYNINFAQPKQSNKLYITDKITRNIYFVLQPYEDTGVAYDITEIPVQEANRGLFAVSATAGAHAQNLGFWLLGVVDGQWKIFVDYKTLAQHGFKPDEWNRVYSKYDDGNSCYAISSRTEYMPPWGKISADLIELEKNRWGCIWNERRKDFDLKALGVEKEAFITDARKAAMYLEMFLKKHNVYGNLLDGAKLRYSCKNPDGADGLEIHEFVVVEDHPTHVVRRATLRINEIADVFYYDVALDKWKKI